MPSWSSRMRGKCWARAAAAFVMLSACGGANLLSLTAAASLNYSPLMRADFAAAHHNYVRRLRAVGSDEDYDENAEIIPALVAPSEKPLGDRIQEYAKQLAESLRGAWESLEESLRHCMAALEELFGTVVCVDSEADCDTPAADAEAKDELLMGN